MNIDIINLIVSFIYQILVSIGYFAMFRKSGRKGWYGLIPSFRDYQMAVTVEHEEEGRTYFILSACAFVSNLIYVYYKEGTNLWIIFSSLTLAFQLSALFFGVRIFMRSAGFITDRGNGSSSGYL